MEINYKYNLLMYSFEVLLEFPFFATLYFLCHLISELLCAIPK